MASEFEIECVIKARCRVKVVAENSNEAWDKVVQQNIDDVDLSTVKPFGDIEPLAILSQDVAPGLSADDRREE
jgi:hypothetical protein